MIPKTTKVFFAKAPADLRKSYDGLAALCQAQLQKDPVQGGLFAFLNKRGNLIKILFRDPQGWCILQKRLDKGRFRRPQIQDGQFLWQTDPQNLMTFLHDIDLKRAIRKPKTISNTRLLEIVQDQLQ